MKVKWKQTSKHELTETEKTHTHSDTRMSEEKNEFADEVFELSLTSCAVVFGCWLSVAVEEGQTRFILGDVLFHLTLSLSSLFFFDDVNFIQIENSSAERHEPWECHTATNTTHTIRTFTRKIKRRKWLVWK